MGDGIGHVAITGVALGLLTGTAPVLTAVAVAIVGATAIELDPGPRPASGDVALALLFYGGIAGGVLLIGLAGQGAATLNTYLFGSLTTVSPTDLWVVVGLAIAVLVIAVGLAPQLFAVCQDEEYARVAGLPVRAAERADRGTGRGDGDGRDADGRAAAGQRADGGPGGDRAAAHPLVPRHLRWRRARSGSRPACPAIVTSYYADVAPGRDDRRTRARPASPSRPALGAAGPAPARRDRADPRRDRGRG